MTTALDKVRKPRSRKEKSSEHTERRPWRAVVDIGSNSVRLVVFDVSQRIPQPVFNEKVLCGLGRGVGRDGQLDEDSMEATLATLTRFKGLARAMDATELDLLATAAVRDASNGEDFVNRVKEHCGLDVQVLSGREEARLSAQGVLAGFPFAEGLMGDLGGGSLELVVLEDGQAVDGITLPFGPLRLIGGSKSPSEIRDAVGEALSGHKRIAALNDKPFYCVGGGWRALARIGMEQMRYPLHMIHGFRLERDEALELATLVRVMSKRSLARLNSVSKRRLETLPYAALVFECVLDALSAPDIVFSALGLREGYVFDRMPERLQRIDPLLDATQNWAARDARFPHSAPAISQWLEPLFPTASDAEKRVIAAAVQLSDVGWREHPDYRAEQMFLRILRSASLSIAHGERSFMALAVFLRYGGDLEAELIQPFRTLLDQRQEKQAIVLGAALRLAYALSGGSLDMLQRSRLSILDDELTLTLPDGATVPAGTVLERRLDNLSRALGTTKARLVR